MTDGLWTITKAFTFSAAHHLPQLPAGHKCREPHGHNYTVIVELQATNLDEYGFVLDYGALEKVKDLFRPKGEGGIDHADLAEVYGAENTTAEILARTFYQLFRTWYPRVVAVTVKETEGTSATFRGFL